MPKPQTKPVAMRQVVVLVGRALHRARWTLSWETSADAILARAGARRMSPKEFDRYFGDLPTDGEG